MALVTLPILVIALCFVELNDQLDCNEGITKEIKILNPSYLPPSR